MIGLILYLVFLSALGAIILFLVRQKGAYFKSVQVLFAAASILIALSFSSDLIVEYLVKTEEIALYSEIGFITAVLLSLMIAEHAALMVYKGKQKKSSWKNFFSDKLTFLSISYKGYVVLVLFLTMIFHPWEMQLTRNIWGNFVYTPIHHELWYIVFLLSIPFVFIAYPCMLFILSSRKYKEESVVTTLKLLAICWICIVATVFSLYSLRGQLGISVGEINFLVYTVCFGSMAYSFKKTNILESLSVMETPPYLHIDPGEHVILFYKSKPDKMKIFSDYVLEGLINGDRVVYVYPDEEEGVVRARLKEGGVDVRKFEKTDSLLLLSVSQVYSRHEAFDVEKLKQFWMEIENATLKMGYKHERDLIDMGDMSIVADDIEKYSEVMKWADDVDPFITGLRAFNVEELKGDKERLIEASHARIINLFESANIFSDALDMNRLQIIGEKILFEFDPASNYEKVVEAFVTEALANAEQVALFTHKGSVVYSALGNKEAIKVILLTQSISVPQVNAQMNQILLPANNTALLLDALNKMLETLSRGNLNVIFDNLSSLILSIGLQKTYRFMRYALDMLTSTNSTALFLFNPDAHDQRVTSSLKSLFSNHISCGKDGLQVVKLSEPKAENT